MEKNMPKSTTSASVTKFYELKTGRELTSLDVTDIENIEDTAR